MKHFDQISSVGPTMRTGRAEHLDLPRVLEPRVADRHGAVRRGEDDVEEMLALEDLAKPALVLDLDGVAEMLEMAEDARVVAGLAEDVEILGRAGDARIGADRIGAGEQERQAKAGQLAQRLGIEALGLRRFQSGLRLRVDRPGRRPGGAEQRFVRGHVGDDALLSGGKRVLRTCQTRLRFRWNDDTRPGVLPMLQGVAMDQGRNRDRARPTEASRPGTMHVRTAA